MRRDKDYAYVRQQVLRDTAHDLTMECVQLVGAIWGSNVFKRRVLPTPVEELTVRASHEVVDGFGPGRAETERLASKQLKEIEQQQAKQAPAESATATAASSSKGNDDKFDVAMNGMDQMQRRMHTAMQGTIEEFKPATTQPKRDVALFKFRR